MLRLGAKWTWQQKVWHILDLKRQAQELQEMMVEWKPLGRRVTSLVERCFKGLVLLLPKNWLHYHCDGFFIFKNGHFFLFWNSWLELLNLVLGGCGKALETASWYLEEISFQNYPAEKCRDHQRFFSCISRSTEYPRNHPVQGRFNFTKLNGRAIYRWFEIYFHPQLEGRKQA